jgi:hypothetical protein
MTRARLTEIEVSNRRAACIVLADPVMHAGIQLEWARLWASRHRIKLGPEDEEDEPKSFAQRLEAAEKKQRVKRIARRRERWEQRQWRLSGRGNPYLNVNGFHIVVFHRDFRWSIRIMDRQNEEAHFSKKSYATEDEAMAGAFDALLYMESKRTVSSPVLVMERRCA